MDTNTGESPGHQSQSQQLGNSPSEKEMGHWTPTGIEPRAYDDDDDYLRLLQKEMRNDNTHYRKITQYDQENIKLNKNIKRHTKV